MKTIIALILLIAFVQPVFADENPNFVESYRGYEIDRAGINFVIEGLSGEFESVEGARRRIDTIVDARGDDSTTIYGVIDDNPTFQANQVSNTGDNNRTILYGVFAVAIIALIMKFRSGR